MNYLDKVNQQAVDSTARGDLENARRTCLASLGEVEMVATLNVLSTIEPINDGLSRAYNAANKFGEG
jgi:hypothetical protein